MQYHACCRLKICFSCRQPSLQRHGYLQTKFSMKHIQGLCLFIFVLLSLPGTAQVVNDSIAYRLELPLNEALQSATAHCTVEKACVDESLTGKCIQYHNDQWFFFTAADRPAHYLKVYGQTCRDTRGVQLVVIDGEACQPETYQVLACVSLATQDDVYLKLDSLEAGKTYLLNIDGYLHDFCAFTIEYSDSPGGTNVSEPLETDYQIGQENRQVLFSWETPADILHQVDHYQLYRRSEEEARFRPLQQLAHQRNAHGHSESTYQATDSIALNSTYYYRLVAVLPSGENIILFEEKVKAKLSAEEAYIDIPFPYRGKTDYLLLVYDPLSQQLLSREEGKSDKKQSSLRYYIGGFIKQGHRQYRVVLLNRKTKEQKEYLFSR